MLDGTFASTPGMWDFDEIYAVKRVERRLHDPNRALMRSLSRATGRRLRLAAPFEARRFVALAFADVTLVSTTPGGFDEAALRWAVHALYRPRAASTPELFDEVPRYAPETLAALPPLVARRLGAVAAPA